MDSKTWRPCFGGVGVTRPTGADGAVTIRRAYSGGVRIVVTRDADRDGIYEITHSRLAPYVTYRSPKAR